MVKIKYGRWHTIVQIQQNYLEKLVLAGVENVPEQEKEKEEEVVKEHESIEEREKHVEEEDTDVEPIKNNLYMLNRTKLAGILNW